MRKNLREDEKKSNDSICESSNLFHRLVKKVLNEKAEHEPLRFKKNVEAEKVVQKSSEANEKSVRASSTAWMRKRGSLDASKESNTARMIFSMLDPEDKGEIGEDVLVKFLLEIGLSLHPHRIKEVLRLVLRKESSHFKVKIEDISNLCKGDHRSNVIIKYLNEEVKSERLNKSETYKPDVSTISINEHLAILEKWWSELDKKRSNQLPVNIVAEFLALKTIIGDSHEGRKLVKEVAGNSHTVDQEQFFALFARPMIKWVLVNVPKKFSSEEWKNPDYSPAFKITCLKRNLIMAGLKCPRQGFSQEEGSLVISAIEKFNKYSGEPVFIKDPDQWLEPIVLEKDTRSLRNTKDSERPWSVPSQRIEAENTFYSEFQKYISS